MKAREEIRRNWVRPFLCGMALAIPLSALVALAALKQRNPLEGSKPLNPIHPAAIVFNGPGGRIEALRIPLANPLGKLPDQEERLKPVTWFFEGYSDSQLEAFFRSLPGTVRSRNALLDRARWEVKSNGWVVTPPSAVIWSLPSDVRERLYAVLARSPDNYAQCVPFRFPLGGFGKSLALSGVSLERIRQLEPLTYSREGTTCFSDLQTAREALPAVEFQKLVELLYQTPTYRLRLHVPPDASVDDLVRYWGTADRSKLIYPLLKSLARVPNGASTSVSILLPPYARLHLYTYPQAWREPTAAQQDCFYTALNFFNEVPNTNFLNMEYTARALASDYRVVTGSPRFGDIIMLHDPNGNMVHACVYIVSDFVFTKNGSNSGQPWVFMALQDVFLIYQGPGAPPQVTVHRRKDADSSEMTLATHRDQ